MRFLVELVDTKDNVDIALVSWDKNKLAAGIAAPRFEVHSIFAGYVVGDYEITQSRCIAVLQGPGKAYVHIAIPKNGSDV